MILRVMHGRAAYRALEGVAASLAGAQPAATGGDPALVRLHLGFRDLVPAGDTEDGDVEVAAVSFWKSAEAATSADAQGKSPLAIARASLRDLWVEHYEIDGTVLRDGDRPVRLVRIATGRFSKPGAHTEMLELLRQRMPEIGDPMVEAYTGRRMLGREVCVTFVSTWSEAPHGRDLEDAFWSDIALRYDSFEVCVYETIAIPGAA